MELAITLSLDSKEQCRETATSHRSATAADATASTVSSPLSVTSQQLLAERLKSSTLSSNSSRGASENREEAQATLNAPDSEVAGFASSRQSPPASPREAEGSSKQTKQAVGDCTSECAGQTANVSDEEPSNSAESVHIICSVCGNEANGSHYVPLSEGGQLLDESRSSCEKCFEKRPPEPNAMYLLIRGGRRLKNEERNKCSFLLENNGMLILHINLLLYSFLYNLIYTS